MFIYSNIHDCSKITNNEQSDIDIDNNKIFTSKITKCFLVEDSGIEPLTS